MHMGWGLRNDEWGPYDICAILQQVQFQLLTIPCRNEGINTIIAWILLLPLTISSFALQHLILLGWATEESQTWIIPQQGTTNTGDATKCNILLPAGHACIVSIIHLFCSRYCVRVCACTCVCVCVCCMHACICCLLLCDGHLELIRFISEIQARVTVGWCHSDFIPSIMTSMHLHPGGPPSDYLEIQINSMYIHYNKERQENLGVGTVPDI